MMLLLVLVGTIIISENRLISTNILWYRVFGTIVMINDLTIVSNNILYDKREGVVNGW